MKITAINNNFKNFSFSSNENQAQIQTPAPPAVSDNSALSFINMKTTGYAAIGLFAVAAISGIAKRPTLHKTTAYLSIAAALGHLGLSLYNQHQYSNNSHS